MTKTIVIVGGVAGGASAAARLRRLDEAVTIILLERSGHISFANCGLPYYLGGIIQKRDSLLLYTPESFGKRFRIDVRVNTEATAIRPRERRLSVKNLLNGETYELAYDELLLSPGAFPVRPPLPGADLPEVFTLRNIEDCDRIKAYLVNVKPAKALVVGGGFTGLEMVENLAHAGVGITLAEMADQVLPPLDREMAVILHRDIKDKGVDLRLGVGLASIEKTGGNLLCRLSNGDTVTVNAVFLCIGVKPENSLAKEAGLELESNGGIKTDEHMRTSDPHIYALGDAVSVKHFITGKQVLVPLAGPANRQGRLAADNLVGRAQTYTGTQGTFACKVFEYTAAATGCSEKELKREGIACNKVYLHPRSHAGYYPGAQPLSMKLLFSPADGKILGAQIIGKESADKRIDVLATAIRAGMTVFDLERLELAYSPPYSSAKDPVNMAGFIAANVLRGDLQQLSCDELESLDPTRDFLVDIRTVKEYEKGSIPGAVNIPLDDLRDRLHEFPKNKRIIIFCQVGSRGYLGYRILVQSGFTDVTNLCGGYKSWESARHGK